MDEYTSSVEAERVAAENERLAAEQARAEHTGSGSERAIALQNWNGVSAEQFDREVVARKDAESRVTTLQQELRDLAKRNTSMYNEFEDRVRDRLKGFCDDNNVARKDLNDLLESLDLDPFCTKVTATISVTFEEEFTTDKDADAIDDAYILEATSLRIESGMYATADDLQIEDTGDWNVDRMDVEEE